MIRCTKCDIEKENIQFETYWHSTQGKMRTRKICRVCIKLQKAEYRKLVKERKKVQPEVPELQPDPIIDYSTHPDYKLCYRCKEFRHLDDYYRKGDSKIALCKHCIKAEDDAAREKELIQNGGSLRIPTQPNVYADKYQKELIFEFLPMLGWMFNEENGIWYKPGFKDENGIFNNITPKIKGFRKLNTNEKREILRLKRTGMKQKLIAEALGVSNGCISNFLKKYEKNGRY